MWTTAKLILPPRIESTLSGLDPLELKVLLTRPDEFIIVTIACDDMAGGVTEVRTRSMCPPHKYPQLRVSGDKSEVRSR